jgi:exopolysaccharide production protein ExoZ
MKLNSIQMLRAIAALMVVYTHSISEIQNFASGWQQHTAAHTALGTFGVDLFFVISGFIIYHSAGRLRGGIPSLTFLWHRFRRINPLYYLAVILTVITWTHSLLQHRRPPITRLQALYWTIILPVPGDPGRAVFQAWTLSYEWYFYLLFFLLILFRSQRKLLILFPLTAILILAGWLLRSHTGLLTFYTDPILFEFLLGVAIGAATRRWNPGKTAALCLLTPGILLALLLLITGYGNFLDPAAPQTASLRYVHAALWGGTAALIITGCIFWEKKDATLFRRAPLLLLLGDASYSIYLFHMLLLALISAFYLRVGFFLNPDLAIPISAVIVTTFSLLIYKWVELPLLQWLKRFDPKPPPPANP